jgi:release factor glutamine methyltransferase
VTERVGAAVRRLSALLDAGGVESARLDAELLVAHVLGSDRSRLFLSPDRALTPAQEHALADVVRRRVEDRESVAHLLGVRGFRYLDLAVDRRALIPRPETELLVELALELPDGATVIDVGTGSGAIALAVADERPDLAVHATDVSPDALALARENAERLGSSVVFHEGDLLAGLGPAEGYLAVLSNPPYIPLGEHDELPPEVRIHDPHLALFGGDDGLEVIRRLIPQAWDAGADLLAIEVGQGQPPAVVELLRETGFGRTEVRDDLAGIGRVVIGWREADDRDRRDEDGDDRDAGDRARDATEGSDGDG